MKFSEHRRLKQFNQNLLEYLVNDEDVIPNNYSGIGEIISPDRLVI
jgi:hypothetical protein